MDRRETATALAARAAIAPAPRAAVPALPGALLVLALLALAYHRTFAVLWTTWTTNDNYSHGPLVPLVSLALVVHRRAALRATPRRADARGLALVGLGCALQIAGVRADLFALQGWSLIAVLFGLALTFGGPALTRRLAFPIAYLGFMLTFPPLVVNQLSFALKEIAVELSTRLAEGLGVYYQRTGMTLHLAGGDLRIEHPCSGLRSLLALLALGALLAGLLPGGWRARLALLASAIPIAIVVNALRLALLIVVAHYFGVDAVEGPVHDLSAYGLYAAALAALLGVRAWVRPRAAAAPAAREAA